MSNIHQFYFTCKVQENQLYGSFRIFLKMQVHLQEYIGNCNCPHFKANYKSTIVFSSNYVMFIIIEFYFTCKKH